jgi:hypothetical protein
MPVGSVALWQWKVDEVAIVWRSGQPASPQGGGKCIPEAGQQGSFSHDKMGPPPPSSNG